MGSGRQFTVMLILMGGIIASCEKLLPPAPEAEEVLAEPIADLTSAQLTRHLEGDEEFARVFSVASGLGPIFVNTSCEGCHIGDGKGHPFSTLTRFGAYDGNSWDPLVSNGGPQLQHRAVSGFVAEVVPSEATGVTRLMPPAVTGLGYVEFVEDATLLAMADPNDDDQDGISGIPNYIEPPEYFIARPHHIPNGEKYIGRFGKKAGAIDLLQQVATAYREDMGITSDFLSDDLFNIQIGSGVSDNVPEPEVGSATVRDVVFYIQTLKVPPRRDEASADVLQGELIFADIGCGKCHAPTLTTGFSDIAVLSFQEIHPYSDFLLHDMGPELDDGYIEGSSLTSEWRTAPLWGIGLVRDSQGGQMFLLHDGRARTFDEAIGYHGGEGQQSRVAYNNLTEADKALLVTFLESL